MRVDEQWLHGAVWLSVCYLAAAFAIAGFRPLAVVQPWLFRASYILFALHLIVPPMLLDSVVVAGFTRGLYGPKSSMDTTIHLFNTVGTALFAGAVVCGLASMQAGQWPPRHER